MEQVGVGDFDEAFPGEINVVHADGGVVRGFEGNVALACPPDDAGDFAIGEVGALGEPILKLLMQIEDNKIIQQVHLNLRPQKPYLIYFLNQHLRHQVGVIFIRFQLLYLLLAFGCFGLVHSLLLQQHLLVVSQAL